MAILVGQYNISKPTGFRSITKHEKNVKNAKAIHLRFWRFFLASQD